MQVNINIIYHSRNNLDEALVEQEIKDTVEGLMMSLRNQVQGISHSVIFTTEEATTSVTNFVAVAEPTPVEEVKPVEKSVAKKLEPKKSVKKKPE
jgi:hypothetical protein